MKRTLPTHFVYRNRSQNNMHYIHIYYIYIHTYICVHRKMSDSIFT